MRNSLPTTITLNNRTLAFQKDFTEIQNPKKLGGGISLFHGYTKYGKQDYSRVL